MRCFGSLNHAPAKVVGTAAANADSVGCSPPPAPMVRPVRATLDFSHQMLQLHVPTAQVSIIRSSSGGFDCCVTICQDDFALSTEFSAMCGITPGAVVIRVSGRVEPSASFCLNAVLIAQVMADPTGRGARVSAASEVQRCIIGVEIDHICAPAANLAESGVPVSPAREEAEPPTIIVRVPPPSTTVSPLGSLAHAQAVAHRILATIPHARLRIEVVEGGEEDLMLVPELGGVGIAFAEDTNPQHPPDYPLTCDARLLSMDMHDFVAAAPTAAAVSCGGGAAQAGGGVAAGSDARPSQELVDDKVQSHRASGGHVTVGAYGNHGWSIVSTGHSFPATLHKGMLKSATRRRLALEWIWL